MNNLYVCEEIDSAHFLENYEGKCKNIHGHRWKIEFFITGEILTNGMLIDFSELKAIARNLDHILINNIIKQPTAENIASYIQKKVKEKNPNLKVKIRVWETPKCYAEVE